LRLAVDPSYMMVGNCLFNRIFVLRLLRYQYNQVDFVFDDRYKLIIMDSNIVVRNIESYQGIILEPGRYITSPPYINSPPYISSPPYINSPPKN
jgi:hypothetical protein